ncbi:MAG: thioesterase [Solobacterium sp.]|nr:thioesterase [Solobacterium sp.]
MAMLFGFPGAGAGVHFFEIWKERLKDEMEFREILHNRRLGRQYCDNMAEAAGICAGEVLSLSEGEKELYFFGFSMGAAIAYETAKLLAKEHGIFIRGLFVAAASSPEVPIEDGIAQLDDSAFARKIRSHGIYPEEFFVNPALLKLILPKIRADYRLIEGYCDRERFVLPCPIAGFFGKDDVSVTEEGIAGWAAYTDCDFRKFYFPGTHYFYYDHQEEIIAKIRELIGGYRTETPAERRS